ERAEADAEVAQQTPGDRTVERLRRLERLAAAVADDGAPIDRELVALGVAAEIVMVVEDQNARVLARHATVEPRRGKAAAAAADHDEVVALLDRQAIDRIAPSLAGDRMRHFERAVVLATQSAERRRIARGIRRQLRGRREPRRNGQGDTVE